MFFAIISALLLCQLIIVEYRCTILWHLIFGAILALYFFLNNTRTTPSGGAIWDEFSEQHQYHSTRFNFFGAMRFRFNAHFGWDKSRYIILYRKYLIIQIQYLHIYVYNNHLNIKIVSL